MRKRAIPLLQALIIAWAGLGAGWQLASQFLTAQALTTPASLVTASAIALAGIVIAILAQSGWLATAMWTTEPVRRATALRRKSWAAAFQRQLNPDAAGRARPRAPGAVPAAA